MKRRSRRSIHRAKAHSRPFCHDFAWAYEYIIDAPLTERCAFIEQVIRRMRPQRARGCSMLDVDQATTAQLWRSVDFRAGLLGGLVRHAQDTYGQGTKAPQFLQGNILQLSGFGPFDAILCRGVLNDLLDAGERQYVFHSRLLAPPVVHKPCANLRHT